MPYFCRDPKRDPGILILTTTQLSEGVVVFHFEIAQGSSEAKLPQENMGVSENRGYLRVPVRGCYKGCSKGLYRG